MGLFKKKQDKIEQVQDGSFKEVQPLSGGNAFDVRMNLDAARDVAMSTGFWNNNPKQALDFSNINNVVNQTVEKYINNTIPPWWVLLSEQANYFCNQFQWKCEDTLIKSQIINTIRCTFYAGIGGLYLNPVTLKFEAIAIANIDYNSGGELKKVEYTPANQYLMGVNKEQEDFKGVLTIEGERLKNVAVFKWGTQALSAWIRLLPYIKLQHMLLEMMTVSTFAYMKKFEYVCNDPSTAKQEMELFFNPKSAFIMRAGFSSDSMNRFKTVEASGAQTSPLELIEYYKEIMGVVYHNIGRRENVDTKKERNISSEVDASQENFDIIFKDVNAQFNIFINNLNTILSANGKSPVEILLEDVVEQPEQQEGGEDNDSKSSFEPNTSKDNN